MLFLLDYYINLSSKGLIYLLTHKHTCTSTLRCNRDIIVVELRIIHRVNSCQVAILNVHFFSFVYSCVTDRTCSVSERCCHRHGIFVERSIVRVCVYACLCVGVCFMFRVYMKLFWACYSEEVCICWFACVCKYVCLWGCMHSLCSSSPITYYML